jgi:hypothetical protein
MIFKVIKLFSENKTLSGLKDTDRFHNFNIQHAKIQILRINPFSKMF